MSNPESWRSFEGRVAAGKFPLRQFLGSSDHSAVFITERQGQAPLKAAIKLIAAEHGDAERQLSRWQAATQLSHPHLIRIFEAGRCQLDGTPLVYVVMECADEDLAQIIPQRPLTPAEVSELLPPLLDALSYLHDKRFVHGCIKPSNVMAVGDRLKLSVDQVTSATETESGRRRRDVYDAPETAAGIISPAGDLWSLGLTLIAALTQSEPSADAAQVPASIERLPEPFRGIARECLHLDPKRRCSIAQIQARLQPPGRSVPVQAETPPRAPRRPTSKGAIAAVVIVVTLVAGLIVFYPRGKSAPAGNVVAPGQTAPMSAPVASTPQPSKPAKNAASQGVVHQVMPDIPQNAQNTITGTIKINVRVEVDSSGKVTSAKFVTRGPSEYFAERVLTAAQGWEFSPAEVAGQPAPSAWVIRFRLRRASIQASAEKSR